MLFNTWPIDGSDVNSKLTSCPLASQPRAGNVLTTSWAQIVPATDLRLCHIDSLVPQLEEDLVFFRWEEADLGLPTCASSSGTGAEAAAEGETAALEFA